MKQCPHGFSNAAFCAMCNAPKGRVYTREASASAAHKGKRNARHKKHQRPPTWSDAAKNERTEFVRADGVHPMNPAGDAHDAAKVLVIETLLLAALVGMWVPPLVMWLTLHWR